MVYNGSMGDKKKTKTQTAYQKVGKTSAKERSTSAKEKKTDSGRDGFLPVFLKTLVIVLLVGVSMLLVFSLLQNKDQAIAGLAKKGHRDFFGKQEKSASAWEEVLWDTIPASENMERQEGPEENVRSGDGFDEKGYLKNENGRILIEKREFQSDEITLLFAGDVLLDDEYAIGATLKHRAGGVYDSFSEDALWEMQNADIFMINNEFTYTNRGIPTEGKTYTFRADPQAVSVLDDLGVDIVSIANNHTYDYGEISLLDTLDTLNNAEMPFVGAGLNLEDATQTVYFQLGDVKIAFLAATQIERFDHPDTKGATENAPGVFRCFKETELFDRIAEAKAESDFVVTYIHWGTESTDELDWAQPDLSRKIAEAGADLIIGDHPHVLQPIASVSGVPVIYSLGNYWFNSGTCDTCLVKVTLLGGELKSFQFLPARQAGCSTKLLSGSEKERVLSYMRSISETVTIDGDGFVTF